MDYDIYYDTYIELARKHNIQDILTQDEFSIERTRSLESNELINKELSSPLIIKSLDLVTSIYHIYDNDPILNKNYGGSITNYMKVLGFFKMQYGYNNFEFSDINLSFGEKKFILYKKDLILLNQFFNDIKIRNAFIRFGTNTHFTMIYLTKINDELIKLVYINTGEGVDTRVLNSNMHYDLFKTIYFNIKMKNLFLNLFTPLMYYGTLNIQNINNEMLISYIINIVSLNENQEVDKDLSSFFNKPTRYKDWCVEIFNIFSSKTKYYEYINNLFNFENFQRSLDNTAYKLSYNELAIIREKQMVFNRKSIELNEKWSRYKERILKFNDESIMNFLNKSYDNIKFIFHQDRLLFKLQQAGSCTYKSIIVTMFNYLLSNDFSINFIYNFYLDLSINNYRELIHYYNINNHRNYENGLIEATLNCISLTNNLVKDRILLNGDILNHIDFTQNNMESLINEKMPILIETKQTLTEYSTFDSNIFYFKYYVILDIINKIRKKENPSELQVQIKDLIREYKLQKSSYNTVFTLNELILLGMLWEYYFNLYNWISKNIFKNLYTDNELPHSFIKLFRFKLKINELNWITYINKFFGEHPDFLEKSFIQETVFLKDLIEDETFIPRDYRFIYLRIEKLYFWNPIDKLFTYIDNVRKNIEDYENYFKSLMQYVHNIKDISISTKKIDNEKIINYVKDFHIYFSKEELYNCIKNIYNMPFYRRRTNSYEILLSLLNYILESHYIVFNHMDLEKKPSSLIMREKFMLQKFDYRSNIIKKPILFFSNSSLHYYLIHQITRAFNENKTIDDAFIFELLDSYSLKISNRLLKFENNKLSYKDLNGEYIKEENFDLVYLIDKSFILANILFHSNDICFITNKHLFIVSKYSDGDDLVIQFNIQRTSPESFILLKDYYINLNKVTLSNNIRKYPFMAYVPIKTFNFIYVDNFNNIGVYSISNNSFYYYNTKSILREITNESYDKEYIYISIKDNFLTPFINSNNFITKLDSFYKKYNKLFNYINNQQYNIIDKTIEKSSLILPQIEKILNITDDTISEILESSRTSKVTEDNLHLVNWINKKSEIIKKNKTGCQTNCDKIGFENKENITILINKLKQLLNYLTNKLIHNPDYSSFLEFLDNNLIICSYIMKTNIYIKNLIRLNEIINNCEELSCHEILEINDMFNRNEFGISKLSVLVEIIFGNIIRYEQWIKINEIFENFIRNDKYKIHQFMMGKGKSSIITPMLVVLIQMCLIKTKVNSNIYIIVPYHLIEQTKTIFIEYEKIFNLKQIILSDNDIKLKFLNKELSDNDIYIIDEFDYMYNPLQSNFNIIESEKIIDTELINFVYMCIYSVLIDKTNPTYKKYSVIEEIIEIITIFNKTFIKNVSFGMSHIDKNRICIPYLRKDSPIEGSKFSSNIITIVLTILYFYNIDYNYFILELEDIEYIFKHNNFILLQEIFLIIAPKVIIDENTNFVEIYKRVTIEQKLKITKDIFKKYFSLLFSDYKESLSIRNCSFIDIINKKSNWQVGYTGTVNIDINIEPFTSNNNYNEIIVDTDEYENVSKAIKQYCDVFIIEKFDIDNLIEQLKMTTNFEIINNRLLDLLISMDVIIDSCALFKDIDNTTIALLLNTKTNKPVIFLLSDNTKKICKNKQIFNYEYYPYKKGEVIYYYSQKHIVGIDFKQSNLLEGLLIINDKSKYTDVAQAIYRMRKLNKGHTCHIGIFNNTYIRNTEQVLKLIIKNETDFNTNNLLLLNYQYLKCYNRKLTDNYVEDDLIPLYKKIDKVSNILEIINNKIINNVKPNRSNKLINDSLTKIMESKQEDLLRILFSKNTIEHSVTNQVAAQAEAQAEAEAEAEAEIDISRTNRYEPNEIVILNYKFNPFKNINEFINNFIYLPLFFNNIIILFSYNLFNQFYRDTSDTLIIVKLLDNKSNIIYLFENAYNIEHYMPIAPIYNKYGIIVNDYIFDEEPKRLNIMNIFNISFRNKTNKIDFGSILFNIPLDKLEDFSIDQISYESLSFLIYNSYVDVFNNKNVYLSYFIREYELKPPSFINIKLIANNINNEKQKYIEYLYDYIRQIPLDVFTDTKLKSVEFKPEKKIFPKILSLSFNSKIII